MSKIRSDSIWNRLPAERRKIFENWLFEERIGYAEAIARAEKEWGVKGSLMSVSRFYRRMETQRVVNKLEELAESAAGVEAAKGELDRLKASALKVIGMQLLEKAMQQGDVKDMAALGRVLTQSEEREIQRGRLELARDRFEFKAAKAALKQKPLLNQLSEEDQAREDAEIDVVKLAIFGRNPYKKKAPLTPANAQ